MNLITLGIIFIPCFIIKRIFGINDVTLFVIFGDRAFNNPPAYCFPVYCK